MNIEDKITELNFDTENEDAQKEANILKKKLEKKGNFFFFSSILFLIMSIPSMITLIILGITIHISFILYSIIPFGIGIASIWILLYGIMYRNYAKDIILINKINE